MFLKGYRPSKYDKEEYDRYDPFLKMFDDYKQQVKGLATAIGVDTRTEAEKRADKWRERKTKIADILAEVALVFIIFLIGLLLSKCNG